MVRLAAARRTPAPLAVETLEDRSVPAADFVLQANETALQAIRNEKTAPPAAARDLAIVQTAVYDAVNSITHAGQAYLTELDGSPLASKEAAVAVAAHDAAVALFAPDKALFDNLETAELATIADGAGKTEGVAIGQQVAAAILAARASDGSQVVLPPFIGGVATGVWRPTPPANAPGLLPQWPGVTPFAMTSGSQFRPAAPPALTSAKYAADVNEVKALGVKTGSTRTADQTAIAQFWADGGGTATPPGHWNAIADTISQQQGLTLEENARLFAALDVALADAGINAWDAKYADVLWRPITAIQNAGADGNPATTADPAWQPLLATPPFPTYTSGHSTFSGAAAAVLANFFGADNVAFTVASENPAVANRTFASFSQAANEAGRSRIYGGIHFDFDNTAGLQAGNQIGAWVTAHFFAQGLSGAPGDVLPPAADHPAAPLAGTAAETTVRGLYLSLLGRDADATGLAGYVAALQNGADTRGVASSIMHSDEFARREVAHLYRQFLGRDPDAGGLAGYAEQLRGGRKLDEIAAELLSSPEFLSAHPLGAAWVQALHEAVLGTAADGLALATPPTDAGQARLQALVLLRTAAGGERRVASLYGTLLDRTPDAAGLAGYSQLLARNGDVLALAQDIAGAPEFAARWHS